MTVRELLEEICDWFEDGLETLIDDGFLDLTLGQAVLTIVFVGGCVWAIRRFSRALWSSDQAGSKDAQDDLIGDFQGPTSEDVPALLLGLSAAVTMAVLFLLSVEHAWPNWSRYAIVAGVIGLVTVVGTWRALRK